MSRLLLTAGGTGGHMFPAQALAENLKCQGWNIAMMTDARGRKYADRIPADPIIEVEAASMTPRRPIQAVAGAIKLGRGIKTAKVFIKDWNPHIVVGFGGYPVFPPMRVAQVRGLPTIIHEQNAVLGRVNRLFAGKAKVVASGFADLEKCPEGVNHVVTGNPLRARIIEAAPDTYTAPKDTINLFIVGGSLGARLMSETVPEAVALLPEDMRERLHVVQQTREDSLDRARQTYADVGVFALCEPFFSDVETHLAKAHYVIGRAGASSVSEIALMGKPSQLVPLATAMDDHQTENAKVLKRLGAADITPESEFTPDRVKTILMKRLNDSNWLERAALAARTAARPDAASQLAEQVSRTVRLNPG
ncbi:MAG: UDP-N-acetylglucosamine--N-acetylmuramyl-(pentapeptide) pyrophosphoryl-undecaprenol N-acetylglucosamine transferase [Hyphomonadaceae bacterium]|nr:UDP-N-acetylglucosamine--N-acetylmuramyl-(pentapeptide) pyrophosphoryl-undecaprenol N-acetylglucosamine transferase [Hyphomonadaceae bacterium]MBC6411994.1 UDP-N-acetylglucosamine--N-acetylmuramyl-(pentapeptide) pyrophosphoryl-undecaprenol N-acetylglucosamine transferase [Hyphomonadaceae bacterium]